VSELDREIGFSCRVDGGHGDELGKDTQNAYLRAGPERNGAG
jgi:hypothetical protein